MPVNTGDFQQKSKTTTKHKEKDHRMVVFFFAFSCRV